MIWSITLAWKNKLVIEAKDEDVDVVVEAVEPPVWRSCLETPGIGVQLAVRYHTAPGLTKRTHWTVHLPELHAHLALIATIRTI